MSKTAFGLLLIIAGILVGVIGGVLGSTIWGSMAYLVQVFAIIILGAILALLGLIILVAGFFTKKKKP